MSHHARSCTIYLDILSYELIFCLHIFSSYVNIVTSFTFISSDNDGLSTGCSKAFTACNLQFLGGLMIELISSATSNREPNQIAPKLIA